MAKKKMKKIILHPITTYIILIFVTIILSFILKLFDFSATYNSINYSTGTLEKTIVTVNNMLSYEGIKYVLSNAAKNFISSTTLSTLIITLIGLGIAEETGFIQTFMKRRLVKVNPKVITFMLFLIALASSIVNEVGYAILIPIGALLFLFNGRNPLVGIATSFAGVAFGYGISLFVGTMDINLLPYTTSAANLIDKSYYVRMTSNLFIMIAACVILSIVGTIIIIVYGIILFKLFKIAKQSDNLRTSILAYGTFWYFTLHIFINIFGFLALIPLTGVPLPFLSYGGSYTINAVLMIFVVERVAIENQKNKLNRQLMSI